MSNSQMFLWFSSTLLLTIYYMVSSTRRANGRITPSLIEQATGMNVYLQIRAKTLGIKVTAKGYLLVDCKKIPINGLRAYINITNDKLILENQLYATSCAVKIPANPTSLTVAEAIVEALNNTSSSSPEI